LGEVKKGGRDGWKEGRRKESESLKFVLFGSDNGGRGVDEKARLG